MYKEDNSRCPLCDKLLIGGKCNDCGYYIDNHIMANQHTGFYTNDTGNVDVHQAYSGGHHGSLNIRSADGTTTRISAHDPNCRADGGMQNQQSYTALRVMAIFLTLCFQLWGFIIGLIMLKKAGDTKGVKIVSAIFAIGVALFVVLCVGLEIADYL